MSAIIITGVPGVGKSTIIALASEHTKRPVVVYGDEMFKVAQERGLVKHRDEMRSLPPVIQRDLQEQAAKAIQARGDVIVDTHCTIRTPKGYLHGIPEWVARALKPSQLILVEAPPQEILARRAKDARRQRDAETAEQVADQQAMNRAASLVVAAWTGATVAVVENRDGNQEQAKQALLRSLA